MSGDPILRDLHDGLLTITFNRPEKLNALTPEMSRDYAAVLADAESDDAVRAILVTGEGRGFCAGGDVAALSTLDPDTVRRNFGGVRRDISVTLSKPLVAAVNGPAVGSGLAHALMADVRFASPNARFITGFARFGLVAELGSSWLLPRIVGLGNALDMLLSAKTIDADEALRIGLVQYIYPAEELLEAARSYCHDMMRLSPFSLASIRAQVYGDLDRQWTEAFTNMTRMLADSVGRPAFGRTPARDQESGDA